MRRTLITLALFVTLAPEAPRAAPVGRSVARPGARLAQRVRRLWNGRSRRALPKAVLKRPGGTWLRSSAGRPTGVALVLHGMNTRPTRMDPIATTLNKRGVDCYRVTMTGHDGNLDAAKGVTRSCLLRDASFGYKEAAARAKELGVPLYLVGYSMGAAVANDLMNQRRRVSFDKMILFAPGFTPSRVGALLRPLRPFRSLQIPTSFPEAYKVHPGIPMPMLAASADVVKALNRKRFARSNVPALIFADPKDRLVSTPRLRKMIQRYGLSRWQVNEVRGTGPDYKRGLGHLIIDQNALGAERWKKVEAEIGAFLDRR